MGVLLVFTSGIGENRFLMVHDKYEYMDPEYRPVARYNGIDWYRLSRRYFVFNYSSNKLKFDSAVKIIPFHCELKSEYDRIIVH